MERFSLAFLLVVNLAWAADLTHLDHLCSDGTLPEKIVVKDHDRGEWQPKTGQPVFCSEHYPHYSCCPHDYQTDFEQVNYELTNVASTECAHMLGKLQCARCSPVSWYLFNAGDTLNPDQRSRTLPIMCSDFCYQFYEACQGSIRGLFDDMNIDQFCATNSAPKGKPCFPSHSHHLHPKGSDKKPIYQRPPTVVMAEHSKVKAKKEFTPEEWEKYSKYTSMQSSEEVDFDSEELEEKQFPKKKFEWSLEEPEKKPVAEKEYTKPVPDGPVDMAVKEREEMEPKDGVKLAEVLAAKQFHQLKPLDLPLPADKKTDPPKMKAKKLPPQDSHGGAGGTEFFDVPDDMDLPNAGWTDDVLEPGVKKEIVKEKPAVLSNKPVSDCLCVKEVVSGLRNPVAAIPSIDHTHRLFIVEQAGIVKVMTPDGRIQKEPFINIEQEVLSGSKMGDERGLLSMAFHPEFKFNGKVYMSYSVDKGSWDDTPRDHVMRITEFTVTRRNPNRLDPTTERIILEIPWPSPNSISGQLLFGKDGFLYLFLGNGGVSEEDEENFDGLSDFLGSILRIDLDTDYCQSLYAIPGDNPFYNSTFMPWEVFAYGFDNPWRCTFDSGRIICGDAANKEKDTEKIYIVNRGKDHGYRKEDPPECNQQLWKPAPPVSHCAKHCHHGHCTASDMCCCHDGYMGENCKIALCDPPCANGGTCVKPNQCLCDIGFTGNTCTELDTEVPEDPKVTPEKGNQIKDVPPECLQPAVTGPCKALFWAWHYDRVTQDCEQFVFGGCGGNKNNFKTRQECLNFCIGK
ncbi:PREDICTED: hedgehog-interacting protein-like [Branchiostoma belcheri]|uniref:Hedgehog-interacting protein-like n=1 Tax=Branchiostoma belcheri TaxID=7741 RepID=A0A6P4YA80_BRABE|nr:PREDICTED: hedgehog-interacting protein-like [Branchiostoma belcheri]